MEKPEELGIRASFVPFTNITWNRDCGTLHLVFEAKITRDPARRRHPVDLHCQGLCLLPDSQFFEALVAHAPSLKSVVKEVFTHSPINLFTCLFLPRPVYPHLSRVFPIDRKSV